MTSMSEPKLLMLDEPSLGLAPSIVDQLYDALDRLRDEGLTMLLAVGRVLKAEREDRFMDAVVLAPIPRTSIWADKAIGYAETFSADSGH